MGDAATLRVVGVVAFLPGAVPSALVATRIGRRQTMALGLFLVMLTYGATALRVSTPGTYALVLWLADRAQMKPDTDVFFISERRRSISRNTV